MINVAFVCLGNICRSPMAELIFKQLVNERGLSLSFNISSCGTSDCEEGNPIYYPAQKTLSAHNIAGSHTARQITYKDIKNNDYILVMDGMNYADPAYTAFNKRLTEGAEERAFDILKKLAAVGVKLSYGEVIRERKCKKSPVHATYIAVAGARKGYANSPYSFYTKYLNYGAAGFSCICRPTPEETAEVVKRCGGFCSLAHPARISVDKQGLISLIERLVPCGLRGIEAVYSGHTAIETQYYKELAERFGLLVTGGSDTHYAEGNRRVGVPEFYPCGGLLSALKIY